MSKTIKETKFVEDYVFHEFLLRFQTAVQEGFVLDLDSNERFPQKFGSHLTVTLVKLEDEPELAFPGTDDTSTVEEVQARIVNDKLAEQVVEEPVIEPEVQTPEESVVDIPTPTRRKRST